MKAIQRDRTGCLLGLYPHGNAFVGCDKFWHDQIKEDTARILFGSSKKVHVLMRIGAVKGISSYIERLIRDGVMGIPIACGS